MSFLKTLAVAVGILSAAGLSHADTAELFGRAEETWSAQISPDGKRIATGCSPTGKRAICIFEIDGSAKPKLIPPPEGARINDLYWASDEYLLYSASLFERVTTSRGLEDWTVRRLLSYSLKTGETNLLMKGARGVDDTTRIDSLLIDKSDKILMSLALRTADDDKTGRRTANTPDITLVTYEVNLKNGKEKVKDSTSRSVISAVRDEYGRDIAQIERDFADKSFAVASLVDGRRVLFQRSEIDRAPLFVAGVSGDRQSLIVDFDDGARQGLHTMSLTDGAIAPVTVGGQQVGDAGVSIDRFTNAVVGYHYNGDLPTIDYVDEELASHQTALKDALGADEVWLTSWSRDRRFIIVRAMNKGQPANYYLFDSEAVSVSPVGGEAPWIDPASLGRVEAVNYAASDGLQIPAYLTYPAGKTAEEGPFPLVLLPHGGPEARDDAQYGWLSQALAAQGYLVLQPNFRGSTGYGAAFRNAGYSEFGGKMIEDIIDGAKYLEAQGLAKPGGYCVLGASYGGYAALMAGLKSTEARCLASVNGVADPFAMFAEFGSDSPATSYWELYMGDRFKTAQSEQSAMTPTDRASEYRQPILLIHGKEDTTVPFGQSRGFKSKAGDNVRLVEMAGQDHYLTSTASRQLVLKESLTFLNVHHPALQ